MVAKTLKTRKENISIKATTTGTCIFIKLTTGDHKISSLIPANITYER